MIDGNQEYPKISIVTVVFNGVKTLEQTILSVVNQTYENIEYIIIDGGSTDGTVDLIRKYENRVAYWVSEPDNGIYDAMNKGIDVAMGEWIYFLGADDKLIDENVINKVVYFIKKYNFIDFLCGKVIQIDRELNLFRETNNLFSYDAVLSGTMCHHQGTFTKAKLIKKYYFSKEYKIASDFELFIKCIVNGGAFISIPIYIAYSDLGGISSAKSRKARIILFEEKRKILNKYSDLTHRKKFLREYKKNVIKIYLEDFFALFGFKRIIKVYRGWRSLLLMNINR